MRSKRFSAPNIVLVLLCAMYLILYVNRVNISTVAPLIKTDLKLSNTQLGLAFSAFGIPYAVLQLFGGWFGDRLGPRFTLTMCCGIVAVFTVLISTTGGLLSLVLFRLALGLGEGAAFPTATRALASWTPAKKWGFAQGIVHSFSRLGNAITPPLMTLLIVFVSWRSSFIVLGVVCFVWLVVWVWFFRNDPREHPSMTEADIALLPTHDRSDKAVKVPTLRLARRIVPVTMIDFCYGWTLSLFLSWIPSFFFENYHLNLQASAMFSAGVLFAGVIGDTLGGIVSDRLFRKTGNLVIARCHVIVAGFLGALVFFIPVILIHEVNVAAVCLSLAFFFAELVVGPVWAVPMDIAPRYAGSASGMMNFGFGVSAVISPWLFGVLVDRTGSWVYPFGVSIALLLLGAVLALRLRPDLPFEELEPISEEAVHL
jgi:sugar phosphate permease